jgi:glycerol-3-phosphate dehydrogenase
LVAEKATDAAVVRLGHGARRGCVLDTPLPGRDAPPRSEKLEERCLAAVRDEMALRLGDLVFRRMDRSHRGALCTTEVQLCADVMARELGWSARKRQSELDALQRDRWWRPADPPPQTRQGSPSLRVVQT